MEAHRETILSACVTAAMPLLDADTANQEVIRLHEQIGALENDLADARMEVERLRAKLLPMHFITAPEAVLYLEAFAPKLVSAIERECVNSTVRAIKRLSSDPGAVAWWQPLPKLEEQGQ